MAALKGAMDLESHRSSRRRSSTTKGKKAVLEDELKAFRSVVFAMERTYLSMWTKKQRSLRLSIAKTTTPTKPDARLVVVTW